MINPNDSTSEAFNLKEFLVTVFSYKYLYIASIIVCLGLAFIVNLLSPTIFEVNSVIGPIEDKRSSLLSSNNLFSGMEAYARDRNLENDINSLNSFSLVASTLKKLNLEIGYFVEKKGIIKKTYQTYQSSPYIVNIDKSHTQPINIRIFIDILDNKTFRLKCSAENVSFYNYVDNRIVSENNVVKIDTICKFNETISNKNLKVSISPNTDFMPEKSQDKAQYYFEFYHLDQLTYDYLSRLKILPASIKSSLIKVYLRGGNIGMTIDFLNAFLKTYLDENLLKKNKISNNTIRFIDDQISQTSDSLTISESKLKDYRSTNQVMDLSYQGQQAMQQMAAIDAERSALQAQERYYNYVLELFNKDQDMAGLAPPSSANVNDPIMNTLVLELINLNSQRSTILSNNSEKNLFLGQIENKIKLSKRSIIENVTNNLNTLHLTQNELNYRADKLSKEITKLPRTELNMVGMQRKFSLTNTILTYLLQKRSEAQITMASNIPDYEILEPARDITKTLISPKKVFNLTIAFILGLMLPTIFVILKSFFSEKITRVYDVERLLGRSILSVIYSNSYKSEAVVYESPGSSIAESFRMLRSSLFLRFKSEPKKVLLVTSSQPQDGKSFVSFNLAASIASVGYKTVILDCDLRRPTLHVKFKEENSFGLSNYMMDHVAEEQIIRNSFIKNLSFIPAGPVLANSSELIESGALDNLILYLKKNYEYIIIDTTPSGIIADASLMIKYANINLLVCRNNYTRKDVLNDVINLFKTNKVENFDVVFNDLDIKESRYGRYNGYYNKA
jgi:tyrosine-protein kinase Etk/Wzc